ncbi:ATP-binding protein [Longispora sp. NPDC051575]|uniref:sacsin N-terminal ATP-binding-like domain-containing protein n=1 Tax=Longispora sp. NPDC051575 TaxID=3154943 RepID=UPI00344581F1
MTTLPLTSSEHPAGPTGPAAQPARTGRDGELAQRRQAILAAWRDSPTRFREDANAEEDLLHGGYADRLLVELLTNAADAGATTVRIRLDGDTLSVANDGEPLTTAGLDALTSLRASSKREDGSTGRFGVGFSAVLAVTDEPEILSTTGGVRFSARETAATISDIPHIRAEAERRGGVPVLRLPWPPSGPPAQGWTTEVRLPLREPAAIKAVLDDFDPALLLALDLARVDLPGRVIEKAEEEKHWRTARRDGVLDPALLADRPAEEHVRTHWWVIAAIDGAAPDQVVHAPTPSSERISLPVRLIGTFPLDTTRQHIPASPLTDFLIGQAADAIADLLVGDAAGPARELTAVLEGGFPAGAFDAALRDRLTATLTERPWLPGGYTPRDAIAVPDAVVEPLAEAVDGVLPAGWYQIKGLTRLGVRRLATAEIVDLVSGLGREPGWWRALYGGLADADPGELGALPVPLADGRTVTGAKGLLLPDEDLPDVSALGLRVVHPDAVHPLLERLGARPATPRSVLTDDFVRAAVANSYDSEDPAPIADAVLALVAAAGLAPGEEPWLAKLALPAEDDGEWYPADNLLLPGGRLAAVVAQDGPFGYCAPELLDSPVTDETLIAVGVLDTFAVEEQSEVLVADLDELHLDGAAEWAATWGQDALIEHLVALRDLEWVDDWAGALPLLLEHRQALLQPCRVVLEDGSSMTVPSYSKWWLGQQPVLNGLRPRETTTSEALVGLYELATPAAALLGAWPSVEAILDDRDACADLLDRLGDPDRTATPELLADIYGRIAAADFGLEPPAMVRVAPDLVVPAGDVVVVDQPWLLDRLGDRRPVLGGLPVADLLDAPLLSEL